MLDRGSGLYDAEIPGRLPGRYNVKAEISAQGKPQGSVERSFTVSALSIELSQSPLNDDLLRRIAVASGGSYVLADSLATRPITFHFADYRRLVVFDPRLNRYLFLLIALLFVAEIFLRKRRGMM